MNNLNTDSMSNRLDKQREKELEPIRVKHAINEISKLFPILSSNNKEVKFMYKGSVVTIYPYSGWFTGKTVKDGRGLQKLLNQIK